MPFAEYRRAHGLNISVLKEIRRSPAHAHWAWKHAQDEEEEDTPALKLGRAAHALVLTPRIAERLFHVEQRGKPDGEPHPGSEAVTPGIWRDAHALAKAVASDAAAAALLRTFPEEDREVSVFWEEVFEDGATLECKARLDAVRPPEEAQPALPALVLDFKTVRDASPSGFARAVREYGWDLQAAWYLRAWNAVSDPGAEHFVWLAVEKDPPHAVAVYAAPAALLARAHDETVKLLESFQECRRSGYWPGYTPSLELAGTAAWLPV
jgi:hypothetical protein